MLLTNVLVLVILARLSCPDDARIEECLQRSVREQRSAAGRFNYRLDNSRRVKTNHIKQANASGDVRSCKTQAMAQIYCRREEELTISEAQEILLNVDKARISSRPAQGAKGGDVYVYQYDTGSTKGDYHLLKNEFPDMIQQLDQIQLESVPPPAELVATLRARHVKFTQPASSPDSDCNSVRNAIQAQSLLDRTNAVEFNAAMKCFLVKGFGDVVHIVRVSPKPTCSCRPVKTCYHIAAVQRTIGTWTSPTKRTINLTQLRRNKRACKQRPGRKRPRLGDCDINAAPDAESDHGEEEPPTCDDGPTCDTAAEQTSRGDNDADTCDSSTIAPPQQHHLEQLSSSDYENARALAASMTASTKLVVASCTITYPDIQTLDGDEWVNDAVIHSYLSVLSRGKDSRESGNIYVLPSFLAVRWQCGQYSTVEWLYAKVQMRRFRWLLVPLHINGNHWALLIADVSALTVGIADSMPTPAASQYIVHFKRYMSARAQMTGELDAWSEVDYVMPRQTDGTSCGVLALMAAEAVTQGQPLSDIQPASVVFYRRYIQSRLLLNSRMYNVKGDAVCDMPFCVKPSGTGIVWTQCDQCDRWFHNRCCERRRCKRTDAFVCELCNNGL